MTGGIETSSLLFAGPTGQANAVQMRVLSVLKTNATPPTGRAECVQRSSVASTHHEGRRFVCLSSSIDLYAGNCWERCCRCSRRARLVVQTRLSAPTIGRPLMRLELLVHRQASHHHTFI